MKNFWRNKIAFRNRNLASLDPITEFYRSYVYYISILGRRERCVKVYFFKYIINIERSCHNYDFECSYIRAAKGESKGFA